MRTFLFRAWDGKKMRFQEDGTEFFDSEGAFPDTIIEMTHGHEGWEWMQGAGLRDKKDKPIYEGDYIKWEINDGVETLRDFYIVVWKNCGFYMRWVKDGAGTDIYYPLEEDEAWEVVGNIYEGGIIND